MTDAIDAVVIGAGPAGLACATLLAEQGASVLVADEQAEPGGQIYRGIERAAGRPELLQILGRDYARGAALVRSFRASNANYRPSTTVWQVTPDREVWASRDGRSECWRAGVVVLATGAMERPVPVPGWTLPGVLTAGAIQILLKSSALRADEPMVLAGSGPLLFLLARQCIAAGARLAAVVDTSSGANQIAALRRLPAALGREGIPALFKGLATIGVVQRSGVAIYRGASEIVIEGDTEVTGVSFAVGQESHRLPARIVALHEGVIPSQQITRSIGCDHAWDAEQHYFRPKADRWGVCSVPNILVAGDGAGIAGARAAEHAGRLAALEALRLLGRLSAAERDRLGRTDMREHSAHLAIRGFLDRLYVPPRAILEPNDDVTICRCEEVTAGAVRSVVRQGCMGPNQAKSFLRVGMGPCQGRICGPLVTEVIARARGSDPGDTGYYRIRPPLKPISLGELATADPPAAG